MEMMRLMIIYLITGDKEGNAGDYDEDDRGQEGLAHVEGQLPLRCQMKTLQTNYNEEKKSSEAQHEKAYIEEILTCRASRSPRPGRREPLR